MIHICRREVLVEGGSPECHRRAGEVKTGGREVANIVGGEDHHRGAAHIKRTGHCWKAASSFKRGEELSERGARTLVVAMREMREGLGIVGMENLQRIIFLNF